VAGAVLCRLIAFVFFILCHVNEARQPLEGVPTVLQPVYRLLYAVDPASNGFPSLHAADTALLLPGWAEKKGAVWYFAWCVLIALSGILTKQHTVIQVLAGVALGFVAKTLARRLLPDESPLMPSESLTR